jgi:hypothetical protein
MTGLEGVDCVSEGLGGILGEEIAENFAWNDNEIELLPSRRAGDEEPAQ